MALSALTKMWAQGNEMTLRCYSAAGDAGADLEAVLTMPNDKPRYFVKQISLQVVEVSDFSATLFKAAVVGAKDSSPYWGKWLKMMELSYSLYNTKGYFGICYVGKWVNAGEKIILNLPEFDDGAGPTAYHIIHCETEVEP